MVFVDYITTMGERVRIIEETPEAFVVASKEIVLDLDADGTNYMVMSLDQNAERSQYIQFDDSTFESVDNFKYLGTT
jgi:hypothetical protein